MTAVSSEVHHLQTKISEISSKLENETMEKEKLQNNFEKLVSKCTLHFRSPESLTYCNWLVSVVMCRVSCLLTILHFLLDGYDANESLYQICEIQGLWVSGSGPWEGPIWTHSEFNM